MVDSARPGDEIEITGVYSHSYDGSLNTKNGFPVFSTVILANHVSNAMNRTEAIEITDDDIKAIKALAKGRHIIHCRWIFFMSHKLCLIQNILRRKNWR